MISVQGKQCFNTFDLCYCAWVHFTIGLILNISFLEQKICLLDFTMHNTVGPDPD